MKRHGQKKGTSTEKVFGNQAEEKSEEEKKKDRETLLIVGGMVLGSLAYLIYEIIKTSSKLRR